MSTSVLKTIIGEPISTSVVNGRAVNIQFGPTGDNTAITIPYERIPELFLKISECLPPQETEHTHPRKHCIVTEGDITDEEIQERLQKNGAAL